MGLAANGTHSLVLVTLIIQIVATYVTSILLPTLNVDTKLRPTRHMARLRHSVIRHDMGTSEELHHCMKIAFSLFKTMQQPCYSDSPPNPQEPVSTRHFGLHDT